MLCTLCQKHQAQSNAKNSSGVWATTPCVRITHQAVVQHEGSKGHQAAVAVVADQATCRDIITGLQEHQSLQRQAFIGALRCLYWLIKEEIPHTTKYESLLNFSREMGCSYFSHLDQV